jgi:predicted ATPase/class 3 adenylate cyclase
MDFYRVVDQAIDLLRQRGRVTYRALKRQFDLDDGALEDLTEELIYGQRLAADEDGRVLVWTGDMPGVTETHAEQSAQVETPPASQMPDAERRQLTVMFCDLVDSTSLAGQLDPEDLREVVRAYQSACTEAIQRFEGHVAQLLGDGLLVYFGYPQAHEDDAYRAVHTGLGILDAMGLLNTRLDREKGIRLAVRVGIHTGLVVVGEMGGAGRQEQLALGETPNVAARLQALAYPNTVVMSADTQRLVQGYFDCESLGDHALRGVSQPLAAYRVLGDRGIQSRLEVATPRGLTPLVGRKQEVGLLLERWEQVKDGQGHVILLSGEAGIGKSRLVQVVREHVAHEAHVRWECRSASYYQHTALYPLIDLFHRALHWQQDETPEAKLAKLEQELRQYCFPLAETVPLFAPLLSLPIPEDRYPPLHLAPQRQRQKTLESIVAILLELAEQQPVLFILEDLHWTDPTTLEFLSLLVEQVPAVAIYTVLTCRPHFQPAWHHRSYLTEITVNRLSRSQIEHMATRVAGGKALPAEIIQQLVDKTDGVPLYVEEMTKTVLESGLLQETNGHYELAGSLTPLAIPSTLQDSLMARLDHLVTAKAVAQYASVIGRQFSYALLQAVSPLNQLTLQRELERLGEAELIYQRGRPPDATYTFKHALIQDTAYASLLRSTKQGYHRRIAEVLEAQFPETAEHQPELLARHYTEASLYDQAIGYWQRAGQQAFQRSAHREAIAHLRQGLAGLNTLPETPARLQQELDLQMMLGSALMATEGFGAPDVERAYARAWALCQQMGETPQLFPVLRGLMMYYQAQGQLQTAYQLGEQLLRLAQAQNDPAFLLLAHTLIGQILYHWGELAAARTHHTQALAIYTPQAHRPLAVRYGMMDFGSVSGSYLALELWHLGYPARALQHSQATRILAQEVSHPHSLAQALVFAALLHQFRREAPAVQEQAEAATTLATTRGFPVWLALGTSLHGWALAMQGQSERGIAEMGQSRTADLATRAKLVQLYTLGQLADAYREGGYPDEGLDVLAEALAVMDTTEVWFYGAELYRLKGALLLKQVVPNSFQAEACFHQALDIARQQQAKSWELRAATSLAHLWQSQDKRQDAYDLLAPVYAWFTEGFDTADLKDAKALLEKLEG